MKDDKTDRTQLTHGGSSAGIGYVASLERPEWKVKIKGDAGEYEVWAINWLTRMALICRACGDEWVDLSKLKILGLKRP